MTDQEFLQAIALHLPASLAAEAWRRLREVKATEWARTTTFTPADCGSSKALAIAWFVLAGHQTRLQAPRTAEMYPEARRPDRALTEALARAAMHVDEPLASHLRAIGTVKGRPALKGRPVGRVVCALR